MLFPFADGPQSDPTPDVTEKNECNFVFQTKLESHELLYAAEIDGGASQLSSLLVSYYNVC